MTQKDLIKIISKETGLKSDIVNKVFNATFETIKDRLYFGYDIKIKDFGTFKNKELPAKEFKLPSLKSVTVKKRLTIKFIMSKVFLSKLKEKDIF